MTRLSEFKHPAIAACIAAAEAVSDPSESIVSALFPPQSFSSALARALAHRATQMLPSTPTLLNATPRVAITFKAIVQAIRHYREQEMDVPVDLVEAAFTYLVILSSSLDSLLPHSFRLFFEAIGSEGGLLLPSIVRRLGRDSRMQSVLDQAIEVWAIVTMLDENYMQMTTSLPKRLLAIIAKKALLSGVATCPYSRAASAHLASVMQKVLEEEIYAVETSVSLALPICDLCNCFLGAKVEPYHILQVRL